MPRNFNKVSPEDRPAARGTGSKWQGSRGAKYDQSGGTDQQRPEQNAAAARLAKKSDGGLETEPTKELPLTPAKVPGKAGKDTFAKLK